MIVEPTTQSPALQLQSHVHPLRDELNEELHNRPSPIIASPCYVSHISCLYDVADRGKQYDFLLALAKRYSVNPPSEHASCFYQDFGGFSLRWESHHEFSTFTFIRQISAEEADSALQKDQVFADNALSYLPADWLQSLPGEVLTALHITVVQGEQVITPSSLSNSFEGLHIFGNHAARQKAEIYTSFRLHSDGFGRIVMLNRKMNDYQLGRLVQRVLDIETYRFMSLLGLPDIREKSPQIRIMEQRLVYIHDRIAKRSDQNSDNEALNELSLLATEVEKYLSDTTYRVGATRAYYDLVNARLGELRETKIIGLQSFSEFLSRRLLPGINTCNAVQQRMEGLSLRIAQASSLLRTRIEMSIEAQNQQLLTSMNERSGLQIRMQQAVEGVSVVAIAYYLLGLLKYVYALLPSMGINISEKTALGISVPVVLVLTWLFTHKMVSKITKANDSSAMDNSH